MEEEDLFNILLFKYNVRRLIEKSGQIKCCLCKSNHKFSFLYEFNGSYYCYEHILAILLIQEFRSYLECKNS